ncbi:MAG TPA: T9SS type A sorting domain-containing protein, partial [Bacteroidales bacterium]|nr:T9SS type A sorting domain-containing protein [Bacteroidales bacterium]
YTWRENEYTEGGIFYDSLQTVNSCDSVYILNLTVNPVYEFVENHGICSGDTYTWRENEYSVEGIYYDSLLTVNSCDSVYILNLTVHPVYEFEEDATICDGDTYIWRENEYSVEGIYYDSLQTEYSCDSVYILNLSVYPVYEFEEDESICQGDIYTWRGDEYTEEGTYYDNLQTVNSCDSIYILNLSIKEVFSENVNAEICSGEVYILGSQTLDETGEYTETFVAINGCDSVVTVNLSVFIVDVGITYEDDILSANNDNGSYQWVDCENAFAVIEGETDRIFAPQTNGNYAVIITEGFCTDTSECQLCLGINSFTADNVKVYPNPANSEIFVEIIENADAQIIDALGRIVTDFRLYEGLNILNINDFADGVYYLKINYYNQKQNIVKLIKFSD